MFERTARRRFNCIAAPLSKTSGPLFDQGRAVVVTLFSAAIFRKDHSRRRHFDIQQIYRDRNVDRDRLVSFFRRKTLSIEPAPGVVGGLACILSHASVGWSHDPLSSLTKVIALCS